MRSSWTDERLDDLNDKVDSGFERVDKRFERVEGDIKDLRTEMNTRFDAAEGHMNARFDSMEGKFQALNLTLIRCGFGLATSFVGLIITFVLTNH